MDDPTDQPSAAGEITIREVRDSQFFPEELVVDAGVSVSLRRVARYGKLLDGAAFVPHYERGVTLTETQQVRAYSLYAALYPACTFGDFRKLLRVHRVSFLYPLWGGLEQEEVDLSFVVCQQGRLGGFALHLVQPATNDQEAVTLLGRQTNVAFGFGAGDYQGYRLYENPDIVFTHEGKRILEAGDAVPLPQALLFLVPGRIRRADAAMSSLRGKGESATAYTYLHDLTPVSLVAGEEPPVPHIVVARWCAVRCELSELGDESLRVRIADQLWV
jgi:hypothetical protein